MADSEQNARSPIDAETTQQSFANRTDVFPSAESNRSVVDRNPFTVDADFLPEPEAATPKAEKQTDKLSDIEKQIGAISTESEKTDYQIKLEELLQKISSFEKTLENIEVSAIQNLLEVTQKDKTARGPAQKEYDYAVEVNKQFEAAQRKIREKIEATKSETETQYDEEEIDKEVEGMISELLKKTKEMGNGGDALKAFLREKAIADRKKAKENEQLRKELEKAVATALEASNSTEDNNRPEQPKNTTTIDQQPTRPNRPETTSTETTQNGLFNRLVSRYKEIRETVKPLSFANMDEAANYAIENVLTTQDMGGSLIEKLKQEKNKKQKQNLPVINYEKTLIAIL